MILVSSCLLDIFSKYNGAANTNELLQQYCRLGRFIPVCPEQLGGLPTPRSPVEINGASGEDVLTGKGRTVTEDGSDCTEEFIRGAHEVLKLTRLFPIKAAILKERSPSCGSSFIYDGTFAHITKEGEGVTAALLRLNGIPVYSEQSITRELLDQLLSSREDVE